MKKDVFKLRHGALAAALAMAMGVAPAFADEVVAEAPVAQPAAEAPAPAVDEPLVTVQPVGVPVAIEEPAPVPAGEPVAIDEPPPVVEPRTVDGATPGDEPVAVDTPVVEPVADPVAVQDPAPVDDCGMMCWNVADIPPEAVQKGGEQVDPQIMEFGAPEPTMNVSAELSGAVGVSEQLGAAEAELNDDAAVQPLNVAAETPAVVAAANSGAVNVIRDGHLR